MVQVKLNEPVLFVKVNDGTGGAEFTLNVFVIWQLKVSKTLTVPKPGGKPHALSEFPDKDVGAGVQIIFEVTEAEPAVVKLTQAIVLLHPA